MTSFGLLIKRRELHSRDSLNPMEIAGAPNSSLLKVTDDRFEGSAVRIAPREKTIVGIALEVAELLKKKVSLMGDRSNFLEKVPVSSTE